MFYLNLLEKSTFQQFFKTSLALKVGDWQKCIKYLINPKMNQKVWNLFAETEKVQQMLVSNAKKESLRVYLFSYSQFYDNISLQWIQGLVLS